MCLIIQRDANKEIPYQKLALAIENNPDGFGLSVPEGSGKLYTMRSKDMPDAEELWNLLHKDLKGEKLMLHLRYTTAGATNLRNAHPFPILTMKEDGVDLRMAHNGTLSKYTNQRGDESDTRRFTRMYVRPLFKRLTKAYSLQEVMDDDFTQYLLDDQLSAASVLSFIDGNGNTMVVNAKGNGGFEEDGIYYSNKYSFEKDYRAPSYYKGYGSAWAGYGNNTTTTTKKDDARNDNVTTMKPREHAKDTQVTMFSETYDLKDWRELFDITDDTIDWLVYNDVDTARSLISELLFRLQETDNELQKLSKKVN